MGLINRAFRNVIRKRARTLLVALALGFSIAAIMSVNMGIEASKANTQEMIDEELERMDYIVQGVNSTFQELENISEIQARQIMVQNSSGGMGMPGGGVPGGGMPGMRGGSVVYQSDLDLISGLNLTDIAVPVASYRPRPDMQNRENFDFNAMYSVSGVYLESDINPLYSGAPSVIDGRSLTEGDTGVTVIDEALKDYNDVDIGDTIVFDEEEFVIVGICESSNFKTAYVSMEDAQSLAGLESDEYNSINVYAKTVDDVVELETEIENLTGYSATTMEEMGQQQFGNFRDRATGNRMTDLEAESQAQIDTLTADMDKIESTGNQIIVISAISAGLIVMFLMLYTVKERTKEIGVLKALGFTGKNVMGQFISEGMIIGLMGGVLGILLALVASPVLADLLLPSSEAFTTSNPTVELMLLAVVLTVCLGALGSLYPAWSASRKDPVEAMRNE